MNTQHTSPRDAADVLIQGVMTATVKIALEKGLNPDTQKLTTAIRAGLKANLSAVRTQPGRRHRGAADRRRNDY